MKKLIFIGLLLVGLVVGCTSQDVSECTLDSDCVPATCCHASECVPAGEAPDCTDVFCTMECAPGTLDCGQGSCQCIDGACNAVIE